MVANEFQPLLLRLPFETVGDVIYIIIKTSYPHAVS